MNCFVFRIYTSTKHKTAENASALLTIIVNISIGPIHKCSHVKFLEAIVGVLLKDGFLWTLEKLLRENNKYFKKNKQWVFLVNLANITKKRMHVV